MPPELLTTVFVYRPVSNDAPMSRSFLLGVFIVVCNNTNVSKLVYDYVAGWEKALKNGKTVLVPGQLPIFSNVANGGWISRPNTILIDSEQLESGDALDDCAGCAVSASRERACTLARAR